MRDYFYEGIKRLDWGFNNPNITAGLIAILMVTVWILSRMHRWGFWPALLLYTGLAVCLIQTVSRGGLVAAAVSGVLLVFLTPRPWPKSRWIPVAICVTGLVGYAFWHGVASRYALGIVEEDRSVTNRWIIYRNVPAMMVDAPAGWGLKKGSEAFHNFYQPEGRFERYGSLVSSHFTWMVEFSWWGRAAYLLAWSFLLLLCWPSGKRSWYGVACAAWGAFATAALFTTMANRWVLWIVPGVLLLAVLIERIRLKDWPSRRRSLVPLGISGVVLRGLLVAGSLIRPSHPKVAQDGAWVTLGSEGETEGRTWVVEPDPAVVGKAYGQKIRGLVSEDSWSGPRIAIEWQEGEMAPSSEDRLFFSGAGVTALKGATLEQAREAQEWILLNPEAPSGELYESLDQCPPIRVVWGEFNPGQGRLIWQALAGKSEQVTFERVTAAGKFLPDWTLFLHPNHEPSDS